MTLDNLLVLFKFLDLILHIEAHSIVKLLEAAEINNSIDQSLYHLNIVCGDVKIVYVWKG